MALAGCGQLLPGNATTWDTAPLGVPVRWSLVAPGALAVASQPDRVGLTTCGDLDHRCVIQLDGVYLASQPDDAVRVVAHEFGHALDKWRGGSGADEAWAEGYAARYLAACGQSLAPLWGSERDARPCNCASPPAEP